MSSALGIAAVSAVLESLLNNVYSSAGMGSSVTVSAVAPDIVQHSLGSGATAPLQVNLFLHQVTPNAAWRNVGLPSLDADGSTRLKNPPLALDLHYLVTAYASQNFLAEALLGYAVQLLHDNPVLTREQISAHLASLSNDDSPLKLLPLSGLDSQIEMIKITPSVMGREEMAWLWTALKADYRPTFPFQVSVVLIQSQNPVQSALPVLKRRVSAQAGLQGGWASLTQVNPPRGQPAANFGDAVTVLGANLAGAVNVILTNARLNLKVPPAILAPAAVSATSLQFTVPAAGTAVSPPASDELPAGLYLLSVQVSSGADVIATNSLRLGLAPAITALPASPIVPDADGNATVTITCAPTLLFGQQVSLSIGSWSAPVNAFTTATHTPSFSFSALKSTSQAVPVRLQVDGVESPIIDMTKTPPIFSGPSIQIA